ncbi:VOC family protein [Georgenia sp. TF02-10]|uniref:VOC family protein n=1 Tax=Georgenia sp. TF02-10 TaxID=2917725 RepID=UPI001FA6C8F8|nr:VOC family protein [Georgenia sp. TF02-10]UNX54609.1 VOC family protein [Georgenia sp. TF02-10]
MARPVQIVIDAASPARLAEFWLAALENRGYVIPGPPGNFPDWPAFLAAQGVPEDRWDSASAIEDPAGAQPRIYFQRVPEPKTVKNRVHLDLQAGGGPTVPLAEQRERVAAEVARLVGLGATRLAEHTELGTHWVVMQDPEGNEFCV